MKFVIKVILIILLSGFTQYFYDWRAVVLVAFVMNVWLFHRSAFISFFSGFLSIFLLWGIYALYIHFATNAILTNKIIALFNLPARYSFLTILLTALFGGLAGGLGALTGYHFKSMFVKRRLYYGKNKW